MLIYFFQYIKYPCIFGHRSHLTEVTCFHILRTGIVGWQINKKLSIHLLFCSAVHMQRLNSPCKTVWKCFARHEYRKYGIHLHLMLEKVFVFLKVLLTSFIIKFSLFLWYTTYAYLVISHCCCGQLAYLLLLTFQRCFEMTIFR